MSARDKFKMMYSHLRKQLNRPGFNRASWLNGYLSRGGVCRAAALAVIGSQGR